MLHIDRIQKALAATMLGTVHHFPTIHSTNTYAIQQAQEGAPAGEVYIADEQTAGRGRGGHTWHSRAGDGLYLSVLLRPQLAAAEALKLSLATAIAAQSAIRSSTGCNIDLRWPNDLVLPQPDGPSKKLGGILTESAAAPDGTLRYAVIGIGINLNHASMPEDVAATATSLRLALGHTVSREDVCIALLLQLASETTACVEDSASVLGRFEAASSWVHGKRVTVAEEEGYTGMTDGLSATGLLRVLTEDGSVRKVRHGGVREAPRS